MAIRTIQVDYNSRTFDLDLLGLITNYIDRWWFTEYFFGFGRFIAILLEHTAGNFPLWLMPGKAIILSLWKKNMKYMRKKVLDLLENNEIRPQEVKRQ
jgi:threonyl-tRNA synthetase